MQSLLAAIASLLAIALLAAIDSLLAAIAIYCLVFAGRGLHKGKHNPGKVHPSHNVCYIAFGDNEIACNDYEVLVNPGQ